MVAPAKTALDRVLGGLVNSLSTEAARTVAESKLDSDTQSILDQLADKANDGTLTATEREEYLELVEAIDFLSIVQAKVRKAIDQRSRP